MHWMQVVKSLCRELAKDQPGQCATLCDKAAIAPVGMLSALVLSHRQHTEPAEQAAAALNRKTSCTVHSCRLEAMNATLFSTADALHVSAYTHLIVYRQEVRSNLEKSVAADEHHTAALKLH